MTRFDAHFLASLSLFFALAVIIPTPPLYAAPSSAAVQTNSTQQKTAEDMTPEKLFSLLKDGAKVIDNYINEVKSPTQNATERVYNVLHDGAKIIESHFDTSLEASVNATAKLFSILEGTAKDLGSNINNPMQTGVNATEKLFNQLRETAKTLEKEMSAPSTEPKMNFSRLQVLNKCEQEITAQYLEENYPLPPREATMLLFWQGTPKGEYITFSKKNQPAFTEKLSTIFASNSANTVDLITGELITYSYTLCPEKPALPETPSNLMQK